MSERNDTRYTQDRELSWLSFNRRVLEEAWDESVPLFERLKFAAIFTSNLDEFFMVRVGSLSDMALLKHVHIDNKTGRTPTEQLRAIFKAVIPLYRERDKVVAMLEHRLRACNICRLLPEELDGKERRRAERWFHGEVSPLLSPMVVDGHHPFPHLPSTALHVALTLRRGGRHCLALVPIPKSVPLFLRLEEHGLRYVLTEHLVLWLADQLFDTWQVAEKCIISVTRNADISPEDEDYDVDADFRQHMRKILSKRARLSPVRLEIQGEASESLVSRLLQRLALSRSQVFRTKAPISMRYVSALERLLPEESAKALCYAAHTPRWPAWLPLETPMLPQVLCRDILLYYPYHAMEPFLKLLRQAAQDAQVLSIKMTLYRLASTSKLAEYLCAAAENGKEVTVLLELRARFDEQNNIDWAERLESAGCTVLYGTEGYKVHAKLCLITRRDGAGIRYFTQIGTGNYHEKTAKCYSDLCLITAHQGIGADAAAFFHNMSTANLAGKYRYLWVAPRGLKDQLIAHILKEADKARQGKPARIFLKANALTDREIIDALAQASQAGVPITLNIRGICCLVPGVPDRTENIRVFSVVGRFLEHPRIFAFGVGRDLKLYLGSADLMTRNTERRVEVACPVLDPQARAQLCHYISLLCQDNVKARALQPDGRYLPRTTSGPLLNVQESMRLEAGAAVPPSAPSSAKQCLWKRRFPPWKKQ